MISSNYIHCTLIWELIYIVNWSPVIFVRRFCIKGQTMSLYLMGQQGGFSRLSNERGIYHNKADSISPNTRAMDRRAARRVRLKVPSEMYKRAMMSRLGTSSR